MIKGQNKQHLNLYLSGKKRVSHSCEAEKMSCATSTSFNSRQYQHAEQKLIYFLLKEDGENLSKHINKAIY